VCVFELLYTLNCAVQLLWCWLGVGCGSALGDAQSFLVASTSHVWRRRHEFLLSDAINSRIRLVIITSLDACRKGSVGFRP